MSDSLFTPSVCRVKLSRAKGWRMPPNTVKVTRPGKWGNPFIAGKTYRTVVGTDLPVKDASHAVSLFRACAWAGWQHEAKKELGGKNLACWCPLDQPCHADVLLEIANG
jgi:hypothetical protein